MKDNVIVLTTGSSGSSVLTGVIAGQGYWLGHRTKKLQFDTYENFDLVDLNIDILRKSGFDRHDCNDLPPPSIDNIKRLENTVDVSPYLKFVEECDKRRPWLWKDPRLSFTIHFWARITDLKNCKFILIDREPDQSYAGLILSRKVPMSFLEHSCMNNNYIKSCELFFRENGISCLACKFEDIVVSPNRWIENVNAFLGTQIEMQDIKSVYKGKMYKKRYSRLDFLRARIMYIIRRYLTKDYITFPRG
jgi:hypothetical protein